MIDSKPATPQDTNNIVGSSIGSAMVVTVGVCVILDFLAFVLCD